MKGVYDMLRIEGYVWNRDGCMNRVAIEVSGTDSRGNAWAATTDLGELTARMCRHAPSEAHEDERACYRKTVSITLPNAVKSITKIAVHPGMPLIGAVLTVMGDS